MEANNQVFADKLFLVVDDEELVREVTVMMIEDAGGRTVTAKDGTDAVEQFKRNHSKLTAVFMDFSMPGLNGFEAYEQMIKINDAVPVILVSGLRITPEAQAARDAGKLGLLGKPFKQDDVIGVLRRTIKP